MQEYISKIKKIVDNNLENMLVENKTDTKLDEMLRYALLLGGKRIRPIIMYMLADIYFKDYKYIEKEAMSIELVHAYSLVHDDLPCMDNDEYRRGQYTVHKKFGQANAVLVGDALLTMSFLNLAQSEYSTKNSIIALSYYSGNKAMILGQYLDILNEGKNLISYEELLEVYINKTAMLLMASVELACISLKLDNDVRKKLKKYIFYLGIAYQIKDDILEEESTFEKIGKKNTDIENMKNTIPRIIGLDKSKLLLEEYVNRAINEVLDNKVLVDFANYLLKREN